MDNTAKEFARQIIALLEKAVHLLSVSPPRKSEGQSVTPAGQADPKFPETPRKALIVPPSPAGQPKPESPHGDSPSWLRVAQVIGIGAAIAVAWINGCQWRDANANFRSDNRAWLEFRFGDAGSRDSGNVTIQISARNPISIPGQFLNVGKTPALDIKGVTVLQIVAMGKGPDLPDRNIGIALTALGEMVPEGKPVKGKMDGQVFEQAPIFPGRHSQFDVFRVRPSVIKGFVEPLVLSDQEYTALNGKNAYIAVWGEVRYSDIFGIPHWTRFCTTQGAGFDVSNEKCVKYGNVDKNK